MWWRNPVTCGEDIDVSSLFHLVSSITPLLMTRVSVLQRVASILTCTRRSRLLRQVRQTSHLQRISVWLTHIAWCVQIRSGPRVYSTTPTCMARVGQYEHNPL